MPQPHVPQCRCNSCEQEVISRAEKEIHVKNSLQGRRDFLRQAGKVGLGIGGGLALSPLAASAMNGEDARYQQQQIDKSHAIRDGKAQRLTILHTADIHSQLMVHDEFFWENNAPVYRSRGGFATLKSMIDTLRKKNPGNTLVIDGGDCFQGGGVAALSEGKAIVPLMNHIGYDIMLPGNWEVVYGKEMMMKDMFGYDGAKVCANMFHETDDEFKGDLIFPPYYVQQIAGLRIGFIGYNDPLTPKRQSPAYSAGIRFTAPEQNVAKYIRLLKEYEQCDMVFLLTHMGLAQQIGLSNKQEVKGADFILGADTHERVREPISGAYSKVTEPGAFGSFLARLEVVVEKGEVKETNYQLLDVDPARYKPDREMQRLVEKAREPYKEKLDTVIGYTKTPLVRYFVIETPMDNFITDAIMWKFSPDIALSNGFRFCPPLVPDPEKGVAPITRDYLWSMLPVDSEAKIGRITGKQLLDWLEKELENAFATDPAKRFGGWVVRFKGMEVNFTIGNARGKRVNSVTVKGQPVEPEKTYTFVACEREGDPDTTICRVDGVKEPRRLGATLHTIIEEYLAVHSPVSPVLEGRCTATDAPQTLLTQLMGFGYEFR
ncbi:MAG: bifunctional metallophosphatase/5'-nucleotidase [Chitinophagales bacterium]|nr:bifunctional metallophosphatase/5'-nucleotidase [Chitinophagales bacterium]